jgi:hypothetical protein
MELQKFNQCLRKCGIINFEQLKINVPLLVTEVFFERFGKKRLVKSCVLEFSLADFRNHQGFKSSNYYQTRKLLNFFKNLQENRKEMNFETTIFKSSNS